MKLIHFRSYGTSVKRSFDDHFTVGSGGDYFIEITASARSWWQNTKIERSFLKKDSLTIKINSQEIITPSQTKKLLASDFWNGNILKGNEQTVFIAKHLQKGKTSISFISHGTPFLKEMNLYHISDGRFELKNLRPPKRDRIPWLTFLIAETIFLKSFSLTARADVFEGDDDDLQLRIDGETQRNEDNKSHHEWYWCGKVLRSASKVFNKDFPSGSSTRRFDIIADGNPVIESLSVVLTKGAAVRMGRVALYKDIEDTDFVRLRKGPSTTAQEIERMKNGEEVEILEERVIGEWIPSRSYIWHKIRRGKITGYVSSVFIEIDGQERNRIIALIRESSRKSDMSADLLIALAGCESLYKPFATSREFKDTDRDGDPLAAKGIFQLTKSAIKQLEMNSGRYHYRVQDVFDSTQNIEGGIRYIAWLYATYYKGMPQAVEKLIAAYNAGQGYIPANGRLTYARIPTQKKQEEAKRHVACVLEKKKKKPWNVIALIMMFSLVVPFVVQGTHFNEKKTLYPRTQSLYRIFIDEQRSKLIFFDSGKKEITSFSLARLRLNELANIPASQQSQQIIHLGLDVVERPVHVFIFSLATSWLCGVDNCGWMVFRYNAEKDVLDLIAKDILASSLDFHLSPGGSQMAISSQFAAGFCNGGAYLDFLDLQSMRMEPVGGFEDTVYAASYLQSLQWKNETDIEFTIVYSCNREGEKENKERVLYYNSATKELQTLRERYGQSGG